MPAPYGPIDSFRPPQRPRQPYTGGSIGGGYSPVTRRGTFPQPQRPPIPPPTIEPPSDPYEPPGTGTVVVDDPRNYPTPLPPPPPGPVYPPQPPTFPTDPVAPLPGTGVTQPPGFPRGRGSFPPFGGGIMYPFGEYEDFRDYAVNVPGATSMTRPNYMNALEAVSAIRRGEMPGIPSADRIGQLQQVLRNVRGMGGINYGQPGRSGTKVAGRSQQSPASVALAMRRRGAAEQKSRRR